MAALELSIDDLLLDLKNPRFDGLANQREALEKIVFSQGRKLVNLADDIATEGLSPAHRMLVVKAKDKKYIVIDGNRRVAALKIMVNPAVLDGMEEVGDSTKKQLKAIAKTFDRTSVEPIEAYLVDEQEARHWIEAIHTGENEGRGGGELGWYCACAVSRTIRIAQSSGACAGQRKTEPGRVGIAGEISDNELGSSARDA